MKLRIYRNSLRFRLSPADVARLDEEGIVAEITTFAPGCEFSYLLKAEPNARAIRATLGSGSICVVIPSQDVHDWSRSETVGLHQTQQAAKDTTLDILIEKDFECLESGMSEAGEAFYPNPNQACVAREQNSIA